MLSENECFSAVFQIIACSIYKEHLSDFMNFSANILYNIF